MGWIVGLLVVIAGILWWIRSALEPVRNYYAAEIAERQEREEELLSRNDGGGAE
jgi:hypothetical protein